ncbi:hypothetical protein PZ84_004755 [Salmonella enterica subsp. enterica]|nr:hypothetical protein [Salmonella enterica subsp. enterica serovar Eastbourne]EDR2882647.1 hypothetical protein [Salmonella enterica subsp. enterica]
MRVLKCFLATNVPGHYVTAEDALSTGTRIRSCVSCGCGLILHIGPQHESVWFEHDQRNATNKQLLSCAYPEPEVKVSARDRKLKVMPAALESVPPVMNWHCAMCGNDYEGEKHCVICGTGIYSTARRSERKRPPPEHRNYLRHSPLIWNVTPSGANNGCTSRPPHEDTTGQTAAAGCH